MIAKESGNELIAFMSDCLSMSCSGGGEKILLAGIGIFLLITHSFCCYHFYLHGTASVQNQWRENQGDS